MQTHNGTGTCRIARRSFLDAALAVIVSGRLLRALPLAEIRLGVTSDEIDDDPQVAAEFLKRFHLQYVEVRQLWGKYNTTQPIDKIRQARAAFDLNGIHTSVLDTEVFRHAIPTNGAALDKEWNLLDAAMERADVLGTKTLRIFSFLPEGGGVLTTAQEARMHELLSEAARRAKPRGFRLAIENLNQGYVRTGSELARLLKAVPSENLGANWDPNNAAMAGEKSFPEGFEKLDTARIFHVHLRDFVHKPDGTVEWAAVGTGEMDNVGQIKALLKAGYKDTFTLETHWRAPQGKMYATETSLKGLLKQIEKV